MFSFLNPLQVLRGQISRTVAALQRSVLPIGRRFAAVVARHLHPPYRAAGHAGRRDSVPSGQRTDTTATAVAVVAIRLREQQQNHTDRHSTRKVTGRSVPVHIQNVVVRGGSGGDDDDHRSAVRRPCHRGQG